MDTGTAIATQIELRTGNGKSYDWTTCQDYIAIYSLIVIIITYCIARIEGCAFISEIERQLTICQASNEDYLCVPLLQVDLDYSASVLSVIRRHCALISHDISSLLSLSLQLSTFARAKGNFARLPFLDCEAPSSAQR